jgi:hypothetical protein
MAARADAAPPRTRRAVRVRLPDPAGRRREAARGPGRARSRLHRPARVVRGLPARGRLGRAGPDLGPARRRGPPADRLRARARVRGAADRPDRAGGLPVRARDVGAPDPRGTPRHTTLRRRGLGGDRRARPAGGRAAHRRRRPADPGRRTHVRLGRRPRRCRVEHRGARPLEAQARGIAARSAARTLGRRRPPPLRPGQVVSGRAAAPLVAELVLAPRRRGAGARAAGDGRRHPGRAARREDAAGAGARPRRRDRHAARSVPGVRARGLRGSVALPAS